MSSLGLTLRGDREIIRKFDRLRTRSAQRRVVNPAARAAGKPILAAARTNAPVLTGALRRSIKMRVYRRSPGVWIGPGRRAELGIPAGDPHYYPAAVEYGHAGASGKFYIRRSFEAHKASAIRKYMAGIAANLAAEARRK